jgi:N-sulfoglucosamine sulfohydrolase
MSRHFCFALVWVLLGSFSSVGVAAGKPNLLLITVDDMSADSIGVFGSAVPDSTPNIDQLSREGLRFDLAHVQVANCMPSRNVMWSGLYPQHNKIEGFYQVHEPGYPTLSDLAKRAGYFTAIRHKLKDSTPYIPYDWDMVIDTQSGVAKPSMKDAKSYGLSTSQAIASAKSAGKPFFLLVNISDPHVPFYGLNRVGGEVEDRFMPSRVYSADEISVPGFLVDDPVVRQELAHYYSSVRRADDAVGEIMQALEKSGEADKTLVMFLSDHGMPFPFAKTQLYHQSTHTPLIFRWPGVIDKGSIDKEHMVSAVDILPTMAEVIGTEIPQGVDGRSFLPLLNGEPQANRDKVFKEYNENSAGQRNPMRAVESRKFLYIFNPWSNGKRTMFSAANETKTYNRLTELSKDNEQISKRLTLLNHRVLEEFYDIQNDPDCLVNLIADPAYQRDIEQLRGELEKWMRDMHDPTLAAFLGRQDPNVLATYMLGQERETRLRRETNRALKTKWLKSMKPLEENSTP